MIRVQNVHTVTGRVETVDIPAESEHIIDGSRYILLPAAIDTLSSGGGECKNAIFGGFGVIFDIQNQGSTTLLRCVSQKQINDAAIQKSGLDVKYYPYLKFGARSFQEIEQLKNEAVAVFVDMLEVQDGDLEELFKVAQRKKHLLAFFAFDQERVTKRQKAFGGIGTLEAHAKIYDPQSAALAVRKVISLSARFGVKVLLHAVSSAEELRLIRDAKKRNIAVFSSCTLAALFLCTRDCERLQERARVIPPLREKADQEAMWEAVIDGTIDIIGSDSLSKREALMPLLMKAYHDGKLSLKKISQVTHENIITIFALKAFQTYVLIERAKKWQLGSDSAYSGLQMTGKPAFLLIDGKVCDLEKLCLLAQERSIALPLQREGYGQDDPQVLV